MNVLSRSNIPLESMPCGCAAEEASGTYKEIGAAMAAAEQGSTAAWLGPLICIKVTPH
jgi:hypothetical protein